ncbi:MAG: MlaD family protein [Mariprofundaceae bacterium]
MNAQARLGAFVLVALLAVGVLSAKIGRMDFTDNDGVFVESLFDDVAGLEEQTSVRMAGVRVGSVESIHLEDNRALVRMRLVANVVLPASTRARLVSGGLVGEKFLSLRANPGDNKPLPAGTRIPSTSAGGLSGFIVQAERIAKDVHVLTSESKTVINQLSLILGENRTPLQNTLQNMQTASQAAKDKLPPTLDSLHQASTDVAEIINKRKQDLHRSLQQLPKTIQAGEDFFASGKQTFDAANNLLAGNRENIYRMIFEMRKAAENLEALSDDLRRNPWKLLNKTREVPASPRARQEKMEELMLSTGRMGLAPAHK